VGRIAQVRKNLGLELQVQWLNKGSRLQWVESGRNARLVSGGRFDVYQQLARTLVRAHRID
jgi:hypothetical protein